MRNIIVLVAVIAVVVVGFIWLKSIGPTEAEIVAEKGEIISEQGIHWHPELRIFVNGEEVVIPQNMGLGSVHNPIHTHEDLPIIHLEFSGVVREADTKLDKFFDVWNKDFMEFGSTVNMKVNGISNADLENYQMKDGDKIELFYE